MKTMSDFHWWTLKVSAGLVEWQLKYLRQRQIDLRHQQVDVGRRIDEAEQHLAQLKTLLWNEIIAK